MSQSHSPEEAIFLAALEQGSRQARESYLAAACGGDKALLARVRELLAAHDNDSGPLDLTLPGLKSGTVRETIERPGTQIGPYKLLQVIGEGGMGVVYMASQREPVERTVALKIIKPGMDTRQVVARFEAERQALALMDHPNIARVLDGGSVGTEGLGLGARAREGRSESDRTGSESLALATSPSPSSGRPYFVMELVKGVPITQYCDEHHLTPRQRLELFVPVCQAIQHAHQKGIIHRDIKPTNILVAEYDQQPVPKIIDFGVAKAIGQRLTEKTMFTEFGQVVGTVEYMSPEQAKLNQLDIDTRTDIYSLGVLLYELLSGETPFDRQRLRSAAFDEVLRIIREEEPPRPSTKLSSSHSLPSIAASRHTEPRQLASLLRGELDWIVMKALEKDRNRRYETANGLAMDLLRYLHDEPVLACPPSIGYRVGKFARRNRRSLVTAALFGVLLLGAIGAIASIAGWAARDRTAQRAAAAQRIALDRAERRIVLEREIEAALGEVALEYSHDRLAHAASGQKRAASLWASGASDPALKQRIEQWRVDLQLAQRLDEIRLEQAAVKDGHYARAAADPVYSEAFQEYGLDFDKLADAALASRVQSSAIRDRLIPALDDWLETRLIGQLSGDKLVAVAAAADGDPWRNRLRQASLKSDPKELLALAQDADVLEHPPTSLLLLASLLRGSGQLQAAIALLEQAQQQYPVDFWTNQNLGLYLMQLPMPPAEKAIGYYRAAVTLRPTSPGVRVNLGNALRRLNRPAEAEREFRTAIELKPDYAEAHLNLGTALHDLGLLDEAEREFLIALENRPNYAKALANLGNIYQIEGRLIEAEFCCRLAVAIDPDDLFAQKTCGDVLLKLDRYAESEAAYREVVRLDPRAGRPHQDLGTVLRLQGKLNDAAAEFQLALRLDPRLGQSQS
ncbi:MAG TPA: protein kinase, partial [Pirellulaceae bacterium]|nr:protein kinase [Pirellulaceae bacterium]